VTITTLGRSTAHSVGWLFSDAFHHEPLTGWIVPDPVARPALMARFFALVAAQALRDGLIDLTDEGAGGDIGDVEQPWAGSEPDGVQQGQTVGASLWFEYADPALAGPTIPGSAIPAPSGRPDPDLDAQVVDALGAPAAARWRTAMSAMGERHPAQAHHYLALVGVAGARQGQGIGGPPAAPAGRRPGRRLPGSHLPRLPQPLPRVGLPRPRPPPGPARRRAPDLADVPGPLPPRPPPAVTPRPPRAGDGAGGPYRRSPAGARPGRRGGPPPSGAPGTSQRSCR